ncbi:glutathione peroxidase [Nematocida sp. AWRm77]|nr:glutathione peroxidase [Nematocida sp. AWRm77]
MEKQHKETKEGEEDFYSFSANTIKTNTPVEFETFKGKVCIVSNTACKCGYAADNFETFRAIKTAHPEVELLLFPSSIKMLTTIDQEHGTDEETIQRLKDEKLYDVSHVFAKTKVNSDSNVIGWLAKKAPGVMGTTWIKWNFTKFLVSADGTLIKRYGPSSNYKDMEKDIVSFLELSKQTSKQADE